MYNLYCINTVKIVTVNIVFWKWVLVGLRNCSVVNNCGSRPAEWSGNMKPDRSSRSCASASRTKTNSIYYICNNNYCLLSSNTVDIKRHNQKFIKMILNSNYHCECLSFCSNVMIFCELKWNFSCGKILENDSISLRVENKKIIHY